MPGLAPVDPTAAPPQAGPAPAPATADDQQQGEPASPEEQDMYDNVVARCYLLMFDEKTQAPRKSVVDMLRAGEPKQALGETAANIFHHVEMQAAKSGQHLDDTVKEAAGSDVFSKMAELASKVGKVDFMADDDAFAGAFYIAANTLQQLEKSSGLEDPQKTSADFDELIQADQSGQLAQMIGGAANDASPQTQPVMPPQG